MVTELITYLKENPFLVAMIGTVSASSVIYTLRNIPANIYRGLLRFSITTITIRSTSTYYDQLEEFVWSCRIESLSRSCEPAFDSNAGKLSFYPGVGSGIGIWDKLFFTYFKVREDKIMQPISILTLRLFTRNLKRVEEFMNTAIDYRANPNQLVYMSNTQWWDDPTIKQLRDLSTVFINDTQMSDLLKRIDTFLSGESYYLSKGVPYKLCVMLSGSPGTGKTSLIHAIASYYKFNIKCVKSLTDLQILLSKGCSIKQKTLVVIEDIDTMAIDSRSNDTVSDTQLIKSPGNMSDDHKNTLQNMLNTLDGFATPHGLLLFVTTNHYDTLDHALVRKGRIDLHMEIGPLDEQTARRMFITFYGIEFIDNWLNVTNDYMPTVGAILQDMFMNYPADEATQRLKIIWNDRLNCNNSVDIHSNDAKMIA